jgi:hypothetical protein
VFIKAILNYKKRINIKFMAYICSHKVCRNSKVAFINIKCFENINVNLMMKIKLHQMHLMTVKQKCVVLWKIVK